MVGMSLYGEWYVREQMFVRFAKTLPNNTPLYCAMHVRSLAPNYFFGKAINSESNGIGMKAVLLNGTQRRMLAAKDLIRHHDGWTTVEGCYTAKGDERMLLIENPYYQHNTKFGCDSLKKMLILTCF
jgi:hypothetical protein